MLLDINRNVRTLQKKKKGEIKAQSDFSGREVEVRQGWEGPGQEGMGPRV